MPTRSKWEYLPTEAINPARAAQEAGDSVRQAIGEDVEPRLRQSLRAKEGAARGSSTA